MTVSKRSLLWPMLGLLLCLPNATGCILLTEDLRLSASYHVQLDDEPQPTNRLFAARDSYQIVINNSYSWAFAHLLRREKGDTYSIVLPDPEINGGSTLLPPRSTVMLPPKGSYRFPTETGKVEYILILSTHLTDDLALLSRRRRLDASVAEDIVATFQRMPGTKTWSRLEPTDIRVGSGAPPRRPTRADFSGHRLVIFSNSSRVGAVVHFTLRHEIR